MSSGYTLIIKPKRGEFLKNYDTFGKMDPFIKVTLGKAVQKSDVATKQGKTPEWKKVLTFDLTQTQYDNLENLTLLFEAFDEDLTSDDWIGKLSVKLSQLKLTPGEINKLTLTDNKSVVVGDIYVEVEFRHGPSTPSNQHAPLDKSSPQKPGTQSHAQTNSQANAQPNRAQTGGNAPGPAYALIVKPKRGKFLKDYDAIGKMDPFIRVTFGKEVQTSDIAQGQGKTPEWKKVLTFALTQAQYESYENFSILFEAFDEDVTTHDYIGKHLAKLPQLKLKAGEINTLTLVDNKSAAVGTIDVEVELRNNVGAPAPSFGARHPIGTIAVKPLSGRFESLNDYQELYLVFIHGEVGFRSGNSEGPARKPSFRDIITFPHFENEEMTVRVFDSDPSRNEMIGEGHINIAKLHRHGFVPGHVIYISNAYQKAVGELSVDFEFIQEAFNHPVKVYPAVNIRKGEYATKKLKYSNPDKVKKNLRVRSENKDIILVSTEALTLPPGGTGELRFKFWAPHGRNPEEKCKIDIIDEDNRVIEETLLFKIKAV